MTAQSASVFVHKTQVPHASQPFPIFREKLLISTSKNYCLFLCISCKNDEYPYQFPSFGEALYQVPNLMQKVLIIATKKSSFDSAGVGRYFEAYLPYITKQYDVEFLHQPEEHGVF